MSKRTTPSKGKTTSLPADLKFGVEKLSGMNMNTAKVHYNSSIPDPLNADAFAQGAEIKI